MSDPSPLAGQAPPPALLVDVERLRRAYHERPDPSDPAQRVQFGTSGHRGSSLTRSFNEAHVLAVTQAVCVHRRQAGVDGPLFVGRDTHALSEPALANVLEVLSAHGVDVRVDAAQGYTPTPAVSHAILAHNHGRTHGLADGIVITPSHNPPEDGGIKYNPPHGGPAEGAITSSIEREANLLLEHPERVLRAAVPRHAPFDFVTPYVEGLGALVDLEAVRAAGLRIGVDPLGGASVAYWGRIAERYRLALTVVNPGVDPTFAFMRVDHDGKIRMDCSSPYAMAGLVAMKDRYDLALGADTDADRHGVVAPSVGLLPPNHFLAVAVDHLLATRPSWSASLAVGRTVVTTALIDRIAARHRRQVLEVPVGFKWFVEGLWRRTLAFGGEESAGASFLQREGDTWTTDKDGIAMGLLGAEVRARGGEDLGVRYARLAAELGAPVFRRIDRPADAAQKKRLAALSRAQITSATLAGDPITDVRTATGPGNDQPIGGVKVGTARGWFVARPSGTEALYKLYAESFAGEAHLEALIEEAQALVARALA